MRKVFITTLMTGLAMSLWAQVPQKRSVALIDKLTATWCPPCGGWGWQTVEELIAETEGKALFMSLYVGDTKNDNGKLRNPISESLAPNFTTTSGLPNFGVNGIEHTSAYVSDKRSDIAGLKAACLSSVDAFGATTPIASPACAMRIEGNILTVDTKVQFWSDAEGDYYLAAYLIEDSVINMQRTPDSIWTNAPHRKVLRGSLSGKPFGELVAGGSINAGQLYDRQFRFTITEPGWVKRKLQVYTVLWRKQYNDYKYVNASSSEEMQQTTTIPVAEDIQELHLFPNPACGAATLSIALKGPQTIHILMTNMTGHILYQKQNYKAGNGRSTIILPLSGVAAGVYNVSVYTSNGAVTRRLTVSR
jgi:hypothetical protein